MSKVTAKDDPQFSEKCVAIAYHHQLRKDGKKKERGRKEVERAVTQQGRTLPQYVLDLFEKVLTRGDGVINKEKSRLEENPSTLSRIIYLRSLREQNRRAADLSRVAIDVAQPSVSFLNEIQICLPTRQHFFRQCRVLFFLPLRKCEKIERTFGAVI